MTTLTHTLIRRGLILAALAGAGILGTSLPAAAHAYLVDSSPSDGEPVDEPPAEIVLEFNEAIQPDFAQVAVLDEHEEPLDLAEPAVDGPRVHQALDPLAPGSYQVSYRVVSADGHPVSGTVDFTVTGEAVDGRPAAEPTMEPSPTQAPTGPGGGGATADPTPTETPEATDGTGTPVVWLGGVAAAVVAAAAALYLIHRRPTGDA